MTIRHILLSAVTACIAILTSIASGEVKQSVGPQNPVAEIRAGGRPGGEPWSRSPVYAANGIAATAQPLATQIALDILKAGGSAADAAIAANAALGLMEPTGNGIGGDLFAIVWDPRTQQLHGLNASGRSPQGRSLAELVA